MRARALFALFIAAACALPGAPTRAAVAPGAPGVYTLPDLQLAGVQNAVLPGSITNDRSFLLGGVGSDLWRAAGDPAGEFWAVTDRGPNAELPFFTGSVTETRRTFPVPEFTPLILKLKAENGALSLLQTIPIVDSTGKPVTGLSNLDVKDEKPYNFDATTLLPYNQSGLDTEGMVRAPSGEFWLSEEYRPSIVRVGADGKVLKRFVPQGIALPQAGYPISDTLPALFDKRRSNRGFEGLAISPDASTLFAALQSPLSNPTRSAGNASRNTRILAFDVATGKPSAEYVYRFDVAAGFDPVNNAKSSDMKISGVVAVDATTLLVLERTDFVAKIYRVSLPAATNILGTKWDDGATSPSLEELANPATGGVAVLPKVLVANLEEINAPDKIEGLALNGPSGLAVINDNDFNINPTNGTSAGPGAKTQLLTFSTLDNSVAAGDVTATSAVLWAKASATGNITFAYSTKADLSGAISATAAVTDTLVPAKLQATGLVSGTTYYYRATDAAGVATSGKFRTPSASQARTGLRFGVSGDWRGELAPYPSISNADERDLAFFVEHGDTIYSDFESPILPGITQTTTLDQYRLKHSEVYGPRFGLNTWGDLRASTAVLATIDDHEVTNDFAGGAPASSDPRFAPATTGLINDAPLFENGLRAFQEYNPVRDEFYGDTGDARTAGERKLYRYRTYGGDAAVFVLDARSFRDKELADVTNPTDTAQVSAYLKAAFDPSRTMLGAAQFAELKADLLRSQRAGITWKFVMMPEPIENLGVLGASDRYEGYAAERAALLSFIKDNAITNVVFVTADIHGTIVNNLTYQKGVGQPQIASGAFEISTGSVAFDAPLGPTVVGIAAQAGLITPQQKALYDSLPRSGKDEFFRTLVDAQLGALGYDKLGLQGSDINATLTAGTYVSAHTFGWTEFEIDAATQKLTVRTYGIDAYTQAQLTANPASITGRTPTVVSEFVVTPQANKVYLPIVAR